MIEQECIEYLKTPESAPWRFEVVGQSDLFISIDNGGHGRVTRLDEALNYIMPDSIFGGKRWCLNKHELPMFLWEAVESIEISPLDIFHAMRARERKLSKMNLLEAREYLRLEKSRWELPV